MSPARDWGPWRLRLATAELIINPVPGARGGYEVDLERCLTCADTLDWIFQVNAKVWATPAVMAGLLNALHDVLQPQSNLCSFGEPKVLTRAELLRMVRRAA